MKKLYFPIVILCLISSILISCKKTDGDKTSNIQYPTTLYELESAELEQLRSESPFDLNRYGFFRNNTQIDHGYSSINDADSVVDLAIKTLIKYSKFSNITSESTIELKSVEQYSGSKDFNSWDVIFKNQVYEGVEVLFTEILVRIIDTAVLIDGHHYDKIFIPVENTLSIDDIYDKVIGDTIEYYNKQEELQIKIISNDLILNDFSKKIFGYIKNHKLVLNVVWLVPILFDENSSTESPAWFVYVDVLSGETIFVEQNYNTAWY